MKKDDLQNIYGEVPAGFHHSVMNALCHLDEKAEVKHRSNKKVLKVVLVCALISAIGVAEVTAVTKEIFTRLVLESEQTLYRISVSIEEFSVKEIKQILKVPEGTVKSRLSKGRRLLSVSLGSQPEQECFA